MKFSPFDKIICRTSAFGINQTIQEVFEELKLKIEESSPGFYGIIKSLKASDLNQLDDKMKFTIWKYFNRATFRSTPFGSFAAITTVKASFNHASEMVIKNELKHYHLIDWSNKEKYISNDISNAKYLLSNSSIYFVAQEIRYIKTNNISFELATVDALPELNVILLTCKRKTRIADIYELMQCSFDMANNSTTELLEQLISLQLLHTDLQPNITGEDYFIKNGIPCAMQPSNYILAERALISGGFDDKHLRDLPEMISFFAKHFNAHQPTDLTNFKNSFTKRFEQQEINLATIMDPEIGIGYGNLAQLNTAISVIDEMKTSKDKKVEEHINYGKLQQFLLKKIVANKPFDLAEFDYNTQKSAHLPNTFSLIFHLHKGKPVLAHTGGYTANSLLGRFTMCNPDIEKYGKEIATLEMNANIGVLFFDIAYQAEKKVDNVNRRKQLYPYELPILTWSDTANPLDFTDILVAVEQNEVVLKSKKFGKRLIPRIPSAYNYTRSDLAVYRFLCDIQGQGLLTNLSFKLQDFFPNLDHYPRVNYKGIVISKAMWLLSIHDYKTTENLKKWLTERQIVKHFTVGYADQFLCFDPQKEEDLWALVNYCRQQNDDIYISEALLDESDFIKDENGNSYSPQYIVNYHHQNRIYATSSPKIDQPKQFYLPGSEWLYFEIYSHPSKSNYILIKYIDVFLKKHKSQLKKWFFIRYADPTPHIRLRLHLKKVEMGFELINALQQLLEPEMQNGFISDLKLQTYHKEIQRYGAKRMDLVEHFFRMDSEYTLYLCKHLTNENQLIKNSLAAISLLMENCFSTLDEQILFTKNMAKSFASEMNLGVLIFKKINMSFNQFKENFEQGIIYPSISLIKKWERVSREVLANCETDLIKQKMLADLIHLHINRLFMTDQRENETIIYHYLLRMLQTKLALSKV
jgi:thiopeptide-type bacteriocin biosynthesis protein